jgi:hypothetical protein
MLTGKAVCGFPSHASEFASIPCMFGCPLQRFKGVFAIFHYFYFHKDKKDFLQSINADLSYFRGVIAKAQECGQEFFKKEDFAVQKFSLQC